MVFSFVEEVFLEAESESVYLFSNTHTHMILQSRKK